MDAKRVGAFLVSRKLSITIILIILGLGFVIGFAISQLIRDPTNALTVTATVIGIIASVLGILKFFSEFRKGMNIPSLEYGELHPDSNSSQEMMGTRNHIVFLLPVKELNGLGQKVKDCEAFMDIPIAGILHRPLYWRNGNKLTISIGLKEELQLFTFSSFINAEKIEIKKKLLFNVADPNGQLTTVDLPFEKMNIDSEVIVTMQVGHGGAAPPKPYKTTIKQILETIPSGLDVSRS